MPTARELLEQADALMRRNRAPMDDDIPVLMDAVPSVAETRPRIPQLPVPDAPAWPAPSVEDLPVLTDAVEEIEAVSIAGGEESEGEPSMWLEFGHAEPSVIGDAPDSIAMVPPLDLRRRAPVPGDHEADIETDDALVAEPLVADEIALSDVPADEEFDKGWGVKPADADDTAPADVPGDTEPEMASVPERQEESRAEFESAPRAESAPEPAPESVPAPDAAAAPRSEPVHDEPALPIAVLLEPALHGEAAHAIATLPEPAPVAETAAIPVTVAALSDAAQWDAIAEEIRMQVLQRIDLFTDTGLRTQLGERLQPIVDRASADLVATINQHVGELLRAYVAEAIEREIESWRRNH